MTGAATVLVITDEAAAAWTVLANLAPRNRISGTKGFLLYSNSNIWPIHKIALPPAENFRGWESPPETCLAETMGTLYDFLWKLQTTISIEHSRKQLTVYMLFLVLSGCVETQLGWS